MTAFSEQQKQDFIVALNQIMPYGKYKGNRLYELPGHYLAWFNRQGFPNNKLGKQMALVFELDHNALLPLFKKYLDRT
ncbi:MAG: DUF3820 family protein [Alcanivoracaceae bacterium]|nr:DUF3820 family protein [Alcanivoracaceae bacterium]